MAADSEVESDDDNVSYRPFSGLKVVEEGRELRGD